MMKSIQFNSRITSYILRITGQVAYHTDMGLILAALLALLIIQSLLQLGLPTLADLPIHLYRTMEYGHAWGGGVIAPRWASNLAFGYGYPLFIFAPPLPYWLGLAFHSLSFSLENSFKLLIILTILLYAIGMYLLNRDLWGSVQAGLVAATAYTFAPFALREALLYGGNVPQFLAIGLFPWTLWAMSRAAQTRSWAWGVLAAFFYAAILLSHLFQALIFTPVATLFGLILSAQPTLNPQGLRYPSKNSLFPIHNSQFTIHHSPFTPPAPHALITIPLGLLLAAFFWLPAFTERVFTRARADIYLAKSPFYVRFPSWSELIAWIHPLDARAANPYVPLTLGVVTLILAALGLTAGIIGGRGSGASTLPTPDPRPPTPDPHLSSTLFFAAVA
ncbi:MAG: glycosyltransferase family 39 protein, partial [Chloroflexi bacterium]|nr:glycosyltransferase family 39 protein [Chloroflexota bacterium]